MVVSGNREATALRLIVFMSQRFRMRPDIDVLLQAVKPGPFSEKQPQWLTLQLCLVTVGVTEWIECGRLQRLF